MLEGLREPLFEYGFKLKGHAFERFPENEFLQRIDLPLGGSWSIKADEIAVGFEITVKEWVTTLHPYIAERNWKTVGAAEIIDSYAALVENTDALAWYPVALGVKALISRIQSRIECVFIPYLDSLNSRKDVIEMWRKHGQKIGLPPRHELSIAILMYLNDWQEEGRSMLEQLLITNRENEFYRSTITSLLQEPC